MKWNKDETARKGEKSKRICKKDNYEKGRSKIGRKSKNFNLKEIPVKKNRMQRCNWSLTGRWNSVSSPVTKMETKWLYTKQENADKQGHSNSSWHQTNSDCFWLVHLLQWEIAWLFCYYIQIWTSVTNKTVLKRNKTIWLRPKFLHKE